MLTVDGAHEEIVTASPPLDAEEAAIGDAAGRILAEDVTATTDQPPFRASAMDGYAVRRIDATMGERLIVIGQSAAGEPFAGQVGKQEAVRIFTGGVVPQGADHILVQEDARSDGDAVVVEVVQAGSRHIRQPGIDFKNGKVLKHRGDRLSSIDVSLIAAANVASVRVFRKPVVAHFDNGDELIEPGGDLAFGRIVGSNRFAMDALAASWGAEPRYLGRAADDLGSIERLFAKASDADIIVPVGGASVGDHDHVRGAFEKAGGSLIFSKVSVKPGKPTWFGRLGRSLVLGLPGNPASAIVCSMLFLKPLIDSLSGAPAKPVFLRAKLTAPLDVNDARETYVRGVLVADVHGILRATAFGSQDSSLLSPLAAGNCLIRRKANAPAVSAGDCVECLLYGGLRTS